MAIWEADVIRVEVSDETSAKNTVKEQQLALIKDPSLEPNNKIGVKYSGYDLAPPIDKDDFFATYPAEGSSTHFRDVTVDGLAGAVSDVGVDVNGKLVLRDDNVTLWGYGACSARPVSPEDGEMYFDTTYTFPVWWNGTDWVNATGDEAPCQIQAPYAVTLTFSDLTSDTVPVSTITGKNAVNTFDVNSVLTDNGKTRSDVIRCYFNQTVDLEETSGYVLEEFINCKNTEDLVIPTTIENFSEGALEQWTTMEYGVNFGNTTVLTEINTRAFDSWNNANMGQWLTIPASVTTIGNNAFSFWTIMQSDLEFKSVTPPTIGSNVFIGWDYAQTNYGGILVHVPAGAVLLDWKTALDNNTVANPIYSINGVLWGDIT